MNTYVGYIRVSTKKQGEHGSSLKEQRAAIKRHAQQHNLSIVEWIEESVTAAKQGRSGFRTVLSMLRSGRAQGLIVHKIDRSARNLRDWADLGELIDAGVDVRFANESLDMRSRGGRLSADIQAIVSADYVRNLRDEVIKGIYGRLRQGILPFPAPIGYINTGKGNPKAVDLATGPLVRDLFQLYDTGAFTLKMLVVEMRRRGLRNRVGKPLNLNMISRILNNPYYVGIIYVTRTGERFEGKHEPLIKQTLFERVQARLSGKIRHQGLRHIVPYRRAFTCMACSRVLIPERQKGHTYYRCHAPECRGTSLREEALTQALQKALSAVRLRPSELAVMEEHIRLRDASAGDHHTAALNAATLQLAQLADRDRRTTDALIDQLIDRDSYQERRKAILEEKALVKERIEELTANESIISTRLREKLELIKTASLQDNSATLPELLRLVQRLTSNLRVQGKNVVVDWSASIQWFANRVCEPYGPPYRDTTRTFESVHDLALRFMDDNVASKETLRDGHGPAN